MSSHTQKTAGASSINSRVSPNRALRASGTHWLGRVPSQWPQKRLRYAVHLMNQKSAGAATDLPYIGMENIESGTGRHIPGLPEESAEGLSNLFCSNDILFGKLRPYLAKVIHAKEPGLCSSELLVLRPRDVSPRYLFYYCLSGQFVRVVDSSTYGSKMPRASWQFIGNLPILIPPLDEQRAISEFLDRETTKIDDLIAKKKSLNRRLLEKRTATIGHAVTKGLNGSEQKSSGVDWIGDMPIHWETWRIKHVCKLETGHTPRKSDERFWVPDECNIPWISLNDTKTLERNDFIDDTVVKISAIGMQNSSAHLIEAGAVVFNRDGARVGLAAITTKPMCVSQHLIAWVCDRRVFNKYLLNAIYAMNQEIYRITAGATIPTIGMTDVGRMTIPVPPIVEQHAIVAFLDRQCGQLDALVNRVEDAIHRLRDYRSSLVSAAVTGQIDVRSYRPEAPCQ
jgi:type I restriction enzyme S subunit